MIFSEKILIFPYKFASFANLEKQRPGYTANTLLYFFSVPFFLALPR